MSLKHFDLAVEAVIREGLENLQNNIDEQLSDIFGEFLAAYLSTKYGQAEIDKIKAFIQKTPISVVYAYADVDMNAPCISIQLISDTENLAYAGLSDFADELDTDVPPAVIVPPFTADSYDSASGKVDCTIANINLATVRVNNAYKDGSGRIYKILGPIHNETGNHSFYIEKSANVTLAGGQIQSIVDFERTNLNYSPSSEQILIGVHSKNASFTKWLYGIVKYFILTRKMDLDARGIKNITMSGSDFHMTMSALPTHIYSRFLTLSSPLVDHNWRGEQVTLIDSVAQSITSKVRVQRDQFPRDDEEDLTVGTTED